MEVVVEGGIVGEKISVEEWLNSTDPVQLVEKPLSDKEREKVLFEVNESIARNVANVPENSCCNIPGCEFKITLIPEARPSFKQQYGCAEAIMPMVKQCMEEWFKNSWTEPFPEGEKNLFNSPWLAVAKKSGGKIAVGDLRLYMDFREINKWSIDSEYFILRAKDLLSKVWGMKVFTELDLLNAYHQIPLDPESKKLTGFYFPGRGQFVWNCLFFGAKGAVTHFQRVVETALSGVSADICLIIYVDNILVASKSVSKHAEEVKEVIKALNKANLCLKPSKCKVAYKSIQFMGLMVDGERRGVDAFKAKVFRDMKAPTTGKDVQAILGFVIFLRDFIPLYASLAAPLEQLRKCKKITPKLWRESGDEKAFESLKDVLSSAPVLHAPNFDLLFIMETDASQFGVGAVLY